MARKVEVATGYVNIVPTVKGIGAVSKSLVGGANKDGNKAGSRFGIGFSAGLGSVAGQIAVGFAGRIKAFFTENIRDFSMLEDAIQATKVTYGKFSNSIISQANMANRTLGLSKQAVISASVQFGAFGKSANLSGKQLSDFSTSMTKLAGDLASFHGGNVEEAITAIGAAYRGEELPMRRYGVLLSENVVRQKAFDLGLTNSKSKVLEPHQRVLAVQALLLEKTKDAQGDYTRSITSTENTLKTNMATMTNFRASLGGLFAPLVAMKARIGTEVFGYLGGRLEALRVKHEATFKRMRAHLEIFLSGKIDKDVMKSLDIDPNSINTNKILGYRGKFIKTISEISNTLQTIFKPIWDGITRAFDSPLNLSAFSPLNALFKAIGDSAPSVGQALGEIAEALVKAFISVAPAIAKILPVIAQAFVKLVPAITPIIPILADLFIKFVDLVTPILQNETLLKTLALSFVGFKVGQIVGNVGRVAKSFYSSARAVKNFVTSGGALNALRGISDGVRLRFMYFADSARKAGGVLRSGFMRSVKVVGNGFKAFGGVIRTVATIFRGLLATALRLVTTGLRVLFTVMKANPIGFIITIIGLLIAGIIYLWNNCETFRNIVMKIWDTLKGWAAWIGGVLINAWNSISTAVSNATSAAWNTIKGWVDSIVGFFSNLGSTLYNSGAAIINGLWDGMKSIWNKITGWVEDGLDYIRSFFPFSPAKRGPFSGKGWVYHSGKSIMQGFAQGIKDGQSQVVDATSSIMNTTKDLFDAHGSNIKLTFGAKGSGDSNLYSGKYGKVNNVTVNANTNADANSIAREVVWEMKKL